MDTSRGTEALVALENTRAPILFERLPGTETLAWPLLRYTLARTLGETELNAVAVATRVSPAQARRRLLSRFSPNRFSSARMKTQRDLLFVVSGTTLTATEAGLKNWLVGDHASAHERQSSILQAAALPARPSTGGKPAFAGTYTFDDALVAVEIQAKLRGLTAAQRLFAKNYVAKVYDLLNFEVEPRLQAQALRQFLVRLQRERGVTRAYERILDRVKPKILMIQTGSYGDRSPLIQRAHARGIEVAEHQHGWIGRVHPAYNFGAAMFDEPLRSALPDTLLTFGEFWGDELRTPSRLVVVGKPHLEDAVIKAPVFEDRPKQLMFISGVHNPEQAVETVRTMRESLPADWVISFRPHPSERDSVESRYAPLTSMAGVVIDRSLDVYEALGQCRAVFGSASTVLFEALAMNTHVFVQQTEKTAMMFGSQVPGHLVVDDFGLVTLMARIDSMGQPDESHRKNAERIWASETSQRFSRFVSDALKSD